MGELKIEGEVAVATQKAKLQQPPMYKVFLLNDDYTPMDFVITVLQHFFAKSFEEATQVMWQIHTRGKGICGVYSRDIAETKVAMVNQYSRMHEYPLLCTMEPE